MEVEERKLSTEPKEDENEAPVITAPAEIVEIKVPRAKIRVTSIDRTPSPVKKIAIRPSTDAPMIKQPPSFERRDSKVIDVGSSMSPTVQITRYIPTAQSPKEKALTNGLDPIQMQFISEMPLATAGNECSDKFEEMLSSPKISREMKNLQTSTNASKILSDYLNTSQENPRRGRKIKELPIVDPEEAPPEELDETEEDLEDNSVKDPQEDGAESDSTMVLPMEPPEKRRKSVYRSRIQARSLSIAKSRKKSIKRQLNDEMSFTSDKEETAGDDDEDDQMSEVSFITNRSLEGRPVNPPPKVSIEAFK